MILIVDTKQARWVYRVARNFCGLVIFPVLRNLTRTDCFFSLRITFCDFQKVPSTFPAGRGLSRRGKNEKENERPLLAGNQYPAFIIFSFSLSTCNQGAIFSDSTTIMDILCKTSNSLYTVLFLNERGKL